VLRAVVLTQYRHVKAILCSDEDSSSLPSFRSISIVANGWMHQDATWYGGGLSLGDSVLDGTQLPSPNRGRSSLNFWPCLCGQTAGWIKMTLGTEVSLGQGDNVLDGDPAPRRKKRTSPNFWPMSSVAKQLNGSICHLLRRQTLAQATLC